MKDRRWLDFMRFPHRRGRHHKYEPFYDDHADYNTNAPSYYDYLARFNRFIGYIVEFINRLMNRNIEFNETKSVKFTKKGDWIDNGECPPDDYDDIIKVSADVKISNSTEERTLQNTPVKSFTIENGSVIKDNGLWSPDYFNMIDSIDDELGNIQDDIKDLDNRVTENEGDITNIKNDITNIQGDITNIQGDIIDINKRIDSILGINSTRLVKDQDYELTFFNGFYSIGGDFIVRAIETDSTLDIIITTSHPNDFSLANDNLTENTLMRHSNTITDVPESRVFEIELLGDYAQYNGKTVLRSTTSNNLWNIRPTSQRASWNVSLPVTSMSYERYMFSWASFADGYNTQLDRYDEDLNMVNGNLNLSFTIAKD